MSNPMNQRPEVTEQDLFALYSLPNDANHYLIIQDTDELISLDNLGPESEGFAFHPFKQSKDLPAILIKNDQFFTNPYLVFKPKSELKRECVSKEIYLDQVTGFKNALNEKLQKLVLSRIKPIERLSGNLMNMFLSLKVRHPDAFIFIVHAPNIGCWIGASPELFIHATDIQYKTVALAGTKKYKANEVMRSWADKDKGEHKVVEKYIEHLLSEEGIGFQKNGPFDKVAGNAVHLCTEYFFNKQIDLKKLCDLLHPTPAVCGLPKIDAMEIIQKTEQHSRRYYAGYLGPVNLNKVTSLYVNLRSMEIAEKMYYLYIGGGIMPDSNPEHEWEETELKATTMQSVIEKMYLYADVIK